MFNEEKKMQGFIAGLVAGSVLGGLAALLFAPKSGKEFRKDIKDKKDGILDDTNLFIENAKEKASDIISDAKKKAEDLYDEGRKKVESMIKGGENLLVHGKEIVEDEVSKVKNAVKSGTDAFTEERNRYASDEKSKHSTEEKNKTSKTRY